MKRLLGFLILILLYGCGNLKSITDEAPEQIFTLTFGSCNKQDIPNLLWDDILASAPDLWIWGGDNIYADTDDMSRMASMYRAQNDDPAYRELLDNVPVIAIWDDHDYGLNDGGIEFKAKDASQQVFLDFLGVPKDSPRRKQEGIYWSHTYQIGDRSIKVFLLDTRYFRTALIPDTETSARYKPDATENASILGAEQWEWLERELKGSQADFNILVSSIQFLSREHGFETWGNFPHEVKRLENLISDSGARGIVMLSGDRHISEFSRAELEGLPYPLVDFTSSGLTHAYTAFSGEPNPFRVGDVVFTESYGLMKINLMSRKVTFEILGDGNQLLGKLEQQY